MTNAQLYLAIGIPVLANAAMFTMLILYVQSGFSHIDKRFDDAKEAWRAELRRVEEILDARLKHLEDNN